jgi:hypothetical protein
LVKFGGSQESCDSLYSNPAYYDSFYFKTVDGSIFTGNIGWMQGRVNNYRFYVGEDGSNHIYYPEEVTHIELKQ